MSAVTAGSAHNSIARSRSSICHNRAARRPVLNFSISALTADEDCQKSGYCRYCIIQNFNGATEALLGSSSEDGQPRGIKIVDAGGVAAGDLGLFVVRHARQDLRQDLARLGKRRLAVRIVRAPHHVVDADDVAQANADGVLLEA